MKKIALISHYLPPAYKAGGPIAVVRTLLGTSSVAENMLVLGSCEDLGGEQLPQAVLDDHDKDFETLRRCRFAKDVLRILFTHRHQIKVIYINSLFDPKYAIAPLLFGVFFRKVICISPRGELHPPALAYKSSKKNPYLAFLRMLRVFKSFEWIVTSEEELSYVLANKLGKASQIHILNDPIPFIEAGPEHTVLPAGPPVVVTCGRIAPIKNHHFVLESLQALDRPVIWRILGAIEDQALFDDLKSKAQASANVTMDYLGARPNAEVLEIMRGCNVLFNPSLSENFGYVFVEAFACGLPVLTSNGTPWKGLAEKGIGGNFDLEDKASFGAALEKILTVEHPAYISKRCRLHYEEIAADYSPHMLLELLMGLETGDRLGEQA